MERTVAAMVYLLCSLRFDFGFLGRTNDDIASIRAGDRTADEDHIVLLTNLHDPKILNRDAGVTHVTWHAHILPDTTWCGAVTNCTVTSMHHGTVGGRLPGEAE